MYDYHSKGLELDLDIKPNPRPEKREEINHKQSYLNNDVCV